MSDSTNPIKPEDVLSLAKAATRLAALIEPLTKLIARLSPEERHLPESAITEIDGYVELRSQRETLRNPPQAAVKGG